jgi:hypothetical protein
VSSNQCSCEKTCIPTTDRQNHTPVNIKLPGAGITKPLSLLIKTESPAVSFYAARVLRSLRSVLVPNGSSNAPAIIVIDIVDGSGTDMLGPKNPAPVPHT